MEHYFAYIGDVRKNPRVFVRLSFDSDFRHFSKKLTANHFLEMISPINTERHTALTILWKSTGLPRTRFIENWSLQGRWSHFFLDNFGVTACLNRGETFRSGGIFPMLFSSGGPSTGAFRKASSKYPCLVRPYEGYYFVIPEIFQVALERQLMANTAQQTKWHLFVWPSLKILAWMSKLHLWYGPEWHSVVSLE